MPLKTENPIEVVTKVIAQKMRALNIDPSHARGFVEQHQANFSIDGNKQVRFNNMSLDHALNVYPRFFADYLPPVKLTKRQHQAAIKSGEIKRYGGREIVEVHDPLDDIPSDALPALEFDRAVLDFVPLFAKSPDPYRAARQFVLDSKNINRGPDGRVRLGALDALAELALNPSLIKPYLPSKIRMSIAQFSQGQRDGSLKGIPLDRFETY